MRVRTSWWKRRLLRLRFLPLLLRQGRMPSGAPAVRELRPGEQPGSRETLLETLRARAQRFELELMRAFEAGGGRVTHPFFGSLAAPQALKFVAVHIEHHRKQIVPS